MSFTIKKINILGFSKFYFLVLITEIFLGGAGRLTTFGPLTLRMYLFIGGMFLIFALLANGYRVSSFAWTLLTSFSVLFSLSILIGIKNGANITRLADDVKMASYFFILPLFDILIKEQEYLNKIVKLFKASAVIMSVLYLLILILLVSNVIPFTEAYEILSKEEYYDEFGFRGESGAFVYKGFAYMCIGFIFLYFDKKQNYLYLTIVLIAIIATLTRGFILTIGIILLPYILNKYFKNKQFISLTILLTLLVVAIAYITPIYLETLGDKTESDYVRDKQVAEVFERTSIETILIGHGYGKGVPIREGHFEITYLEIFHKQGIVGLAFWFVFLLIIIRLFQKSTNETHIKNSLLGATIFLFIQSASNPFLVNSIGLTTLFIVISSFNNIKSKQTNEEVCVHSNI
jgi:hypothetical protein